MELNPMNSLPAPCAPIVAMTGAIGIDPSPHVVFAAIAAGATGILDLGVGDAWALRVLRQTAAQGSGPIGVRVGAGCLATMDEMSAATGEKLSVVVLTADAPWPAAE